MLEETTADKQNMCDSWKQKLRRNKALKKWKMSGAQKTLQFRHYQSGEKYTENVTDMSPCSSRFSFVTL